MWEPKQTRNITAEDEENNKFHGDLTSSSEKDYNQSQCQDSGFLSGPQNLSEQLSDIHLDDKKSQPKNTNIPSQPQKLPNVLDSGLIEDIDTSSSQQFSGDNLDEKSTQEEENMILDSGVVADMSERLGSLSLKASSLNNLGATSNLKKTYHKQISGTTTTHSNIQQPSTAVEQSQSKSVQQSSPIRQNWELYYKQDEEGNT